MLKLFFLLLLSWQSSGLLAFGPLTNPVELEDSLRLPRVFIIGEHEAAFNDLTLEYETLLLTACDDNMDLAYNRWLGMLEEMEAFSILNNFDLKGIKMWINVFWQKDGTISHIAYYLKPQSKNVDTRYLTAFLSEFAKNYRFPLVYHQKYSHYGMANFPVFPSRLGNGSAPTTGNSLQNMGNKPLVKEQRK